MKFYPLVWQVWPSVLWRCWLGDRKGIHPIKTASKPLVMAANVNEWECNVNG